MANLFAIRATDPKDTIVHPKPIGEENDQYLIESAGNAGRILVAWGAQGTHLSRDWDVRQLLKPYGQLMCLGTTASGQPRHPSRISASTKPVTW